MAGRPLGCGSEALLTEGFAIDGKIHTYFGPLPALLRLPLLVVTHRFDDRLTGASMLVAFVVLAVSAYLLNRVVRAAVRPDSPRDQAEGVATGVLAFAASPDSPAVVDRFHGDRALRSGAVGDGAGCRRVRRTGLVAPLAEPRPPGRREPGDHRGDPEPPAVRGIALVALGLLAGPALIERWRARRGRSGRVDADGGDAGEGGRGDTALGLRHRGRGAGRRLDRAAPPTWPASAHRSRCRSSARSPTISRCGWRSGRPTAVRTSAWRSCRRRCGSTCGPTRSRSPGEPAGADLLRVPGAWRAAWLRTSCVDARCPTSIACHPRIPCPQPRTEPSPSSATATGLPPGREQWLAVERGEGVGTFDVNADVDVLGAKETGPFADPRRRPVRDHRRGRVPPPAATSTSTGNPTPGRTATAKRVALRLGSVTFRIQHRRAGPVPTPLDHGGEPHYEIKAPTTTVSPLRVGEAGAAPGVLTRFPGAVVREPTTQSTCHAIRASHKCRSRGPDELSAIHSSRSTRI